MACQALRWRCLAAFCLLLALPLRAVCGSDEAQSPIQQAYDLKLHETLQWRKLVHYERSSSSPSGWLSAFHSRDFFLSPQGRYDPHAELEATIRAFFQAEEDEIDTHPRCRFPGRYLWLSQQLTLLTTALPAVECPRYQAWAMDGSIHSISLLYATGYLGNPASYYGHTLLKFNQSDNLQSSLLDVSVNYGAIVPAGEDPVSYIVKGVFGGYEAGFSHVEFYFHNHNYGELELRDVWEYELNLGQEDVDLIVAHLWELMGKKNTYYFFRQNCAYRIAEILELAGGVDVIPDNRPWTFPQTILSNLNRQSHGDTSLVASIKYHPSRQSRLYGKYARLTPGEQRATEHIADDIEYLSSSDISRLSLPSQHAVMGVLEDYYQYGFELDSADQEQHRNDYNRVLTQHFTLPVVDEVSPEYDPDPPHDGRPPGRFGLGIVHNSEQGEAVAIHLRPSYYDALDGGVAHVPYSALTMLGGKLLYGSDGLYLRYLDFIAIESVAGAVTDLPGDQGKSWKIRAGLEQQNLSCDSCLVARLQGDLGFARRVAGHGVVGAYVGAALQNNRNGYGALYGKGTVFANLEFNQALNMKFETEYRTHLDSRQKDEAVHLLEVRYELSDRWDIRFQYEKNKAEEQTLSIGYYW
ncbi:Lnb N-terminal periplasmic domain-containing protein [Porticoccus sp.]